MFGLSKLIYLVKKSELAFNVISVPVDFLMIFLSASLAYFLRYRVETLPVLFDLSYFQYLQLILVAIPFLLLLFALNGLYAQKSTHGIWREALKIAGSVSAGLMIVVILFFFNRNLFPSRLIILMSWAFIILFVSFGRAVLLLIQRELLARGTGLHRMIVVAGNEGDPISKEIEQNTVLGYEVVTNLIYTEDIWNRVESMHRVQRIDELLQADTKLTNEQVLNLVNMCENLGIKFNYLPSILESYRANVEIDVIGSMPVIRLRSTPLDGWGKVVKRIIDILVSVSGMILFAPLFALIAIAIKLDSRGPVFFHQRRGSSFHHFEFYKFRTMQARLSEGTTEGDRIRRQLEEQNARPGPYVKIKNDPRVTRVGKFLRRTKLDELPQFWHILRGQMSLVGPRIHMLKEVAKFESMDKYKKIFVIKPGATGLAQLNQFTNPELSFEEEIKLDLFYIENWSMKVDLYIITKTFFYLLIKRPRADY
ncbi:MAG: hypothetical protein A3C85_00540 [Candidatus Doudnabacteria bacterium RIFCSPHIGHO2_02_FULL_48_21]|uniref:Bacterial sugar transferase domain-containing protein n=1 Tax=Candidatus Doudnabacteria bacterium RIFCSPLOWO2_02_FULL_48_13 TaxID=1817845 RepID=A0A1F5Q8E2_9BACT|nr:MAG: hypothetical protein A3K05_04880 [Candidatus Doudnabacteria bacterium RIFCSPHIGHO2_01_48_18]OGE77135.1 MAG: hypothetical protein A2668_03920 [Candidatus Doudnabacteria bacterium RIFCSPHIGHO2_01_FULL_48_180]OGE91584.1 MAG: hypothetical protein A3F44_04420 [Candidatus Doudnabacteria bacterium RIFCSPHIGHO2_12_FULL_47_25]OGE93847.1 MAG: hypothetical protein A3C85_00540 [Candidatus Doudnabacteria bacterium RIFCSPHIGHO2_02_FULL_48_21]OGE97642.1 MAG: hypothetical protein A3A83_04505 [Candidatu